MEPVIRRTPTDGIDVERLRDLQRDPAFELVMGRVREMAAAEQQQALSASSWDQTLLARGAREALVKVLQLPEILQKEIRGRKK